MQAAKRQWHLAVETVEARDRKVLFEGTACTTIDSRVEGHYQRIWNPELAEVAVAVLEDDNTHDRYAVTKVRDLSLSIEQSLTF